MAGIRTRMLKINTHKVWLDWLWTGVLYFFHTTPYYPIIVLSFSHQSMVTPTRLRWSEWVAETGHWLWIFPWSWGRGKIMKDLGVESIWGIWPLWHLTRENARKSGKMKWFTSGFGGILLVVSHKPIALDHLAGGPVMLSITWPDAVGEQHAPNETHGLRTLAEAYFFRGVKPEDLTQIDLLW